MTPNATSPPESLTTRINAAERHVLQRHRSIAAHGTMLSHSIQDRLTSPALLASAVGLGFLLGHRTEGGDSDSGRSLLRIAIASMPWVSSMPGMNTLFTSESPGAPT